MLIVQHKKTIKLNFKLKPIGKKKLKLIHNRQVREKNSSWFLPNLWKVRKPVVKQLLTPNHYITVNVSAR